MTANTALTAFMLWHQTYLVMSSDGFIACRIRLIEVWYYGDLFVSPSYRRNKIASRMLVAAIERLKESGATILRTYVDPNNTASINLQKSSGFIEKPYEKFDDLSNEGCIMFELCLPSIDGKAQVPCHKTTGEIPRRYLKITHSAPKLSRLHTPHGPSRLD